MTQNCCNRGHIHHNDLRMQGSLPRQLLNYGP
jgi:hypothetical protein